LEVKPNKKFKQSQKNSPSPSPSPSNDNGGLDEEDNNFEF